MLYFNTNNALFDFNESFNPELIYLKGHVRNLLPFQLKVTTTQLRPVVFFYLDNYNTDETIELDIDLLETWQSNEVSNTYYILFRDQDVGEDINCGTWRVRIGIDTGTATQFYYSNYFNVDDNLDNYIEFGSTTDFGDLLMVAPIFKFRIYFDKLAITSLPFLQDEVLNTGEVTEEREQQLYAETYQLSMKVDKWSIKTLSQIGLYDIYQLTFDEYSGEEILDRIEFAQSLSDVHQLYDVDLTFKVNEINIVCTESKDVSFVPAEETGFSIDDSGTELAYNNAGDTLVINY